MTAVQDAFAAAQRVADAVMLEGYLLYPYRASAPKNRAGIRWQFGVLVPPEFRSTDEPSRQRTEVLLRAQPGARADIRVRFLQAELREMPGELPWDEGLQRVVDLDVSIDDLLSRRILLPFEQPGSCARGAGVRTTITLRGAIEVSALRLDAFVKLSVTVSNQTACDPGVSREEALRRSLISTHVLLAARTASFLSLQDPPGDAAAAVTSCRNEGAYPVLVGDEGSSDLMLSAPIVLSDYPQIAPESQGDFFDATEIDELLTLRTLTLTDAEKSEARATDPRAAGIVDRVESLPREMMEKLHGAVRSFHPESRWTAPLGTPDAVTIEGLEVQKGSRVVLQPGARRADVQDVLLRDRVGIVEAVMQDVDGAARLAITIEGDPATDLNRWYGRFYYFSTDEVVPIGDVP